MLHRSCFSVQDATHHIKLFPFLVSSVIGMIRSAPKLLWVWLRRDGLRSRLPNRLLHFLGLLRPVESDKQSKCNKISV